MLLNMNITYLFCFVYQSCTWITRTCGNQMPSWRSVDQFDLIIDSTFSFKHVQPHEGYSSSIARLWTSLTISAVMKSDNHFREEIPKHTNKNWTTFAPFYLNLYTIPHWWDVRADLSWAQKLVGCIIDVYFCSPDRDCHVYKLMHWFFCAISPSLR